MLHKKTKLGNRVWSLLLCLCMVLPCLPVSVLAAGETEASCAESDCAGHYENGFCNICDGYQAATLNDNGTADDTSDDYYEISNAGQLYWFAAKVNGGEWDLNGKLTADITDNPGTFDANGAYVPKSGETARIWTPIGGKYGDKQLAQYCYKGTFDGNGKTISGLYYYGNDNHVGLFGSISGTIKNLGIVNSLFHLLSSDDVEYQVGGLVGEIFSCNDVTIINCYTDVVLEAVGNGNGNGNLYGNLYGGGLIGEILPNGYHVVVKNCRSTGKVSMSDNGEGFYLMAGGLVGSISNPESSTVDIADCYSASDVEAESRPEGVSSYTWLGGLVGHVEGSTTVQNCYSTGAVSASANVSSGANNIEKIDVRAGGLLGCAEGSTTVQNCYSTGAVSASAQVSVVAGGREGIDVRAGGLIGYVESGTTVQNCYSTGAVSASATLEAKKDEDVTVATAGGLLGYAEVNSSTTVQNCYNTGAVDAGIWSEENGGTINIGAVIGELTGTGTGTGTFGRIYYLLPRKGNAEGAVGNNTESIAINAIEQSADEFASGEVCYLLNGSKSEGTLVWYQILVEGGDPSPVLDSAHGIVSYDAESNTYSSTGTLTATVSVTITWTSMAFTYTDGAWNPEAHSYGEGAWTTSGGTVTVENVGTATVTVELSFNSEVDDVDGSFDKADIELAANEQDTATLTLSGKPSAALSNEAIGKITVTIAKKTEDAPIVTKATHYEQNKWVVS